MKNTSVAIIGAGPYGLSVAAHLAAQNIDNRIFGQPMQFWSKIAAAGKERYLKSYCFGTNLSTPKPGFSYADYNRPRGLETFEPCPMGNFADYGQWFQQNNVPWTEPVDVTHVGRDGDSFAVTLAGGNRFVAANVVVATGLAGFAQMPSALAALPADLAVHTSNVSSFEFYKGRSVAVLGAGQSALEAAALLHEVGAAPQLFVRENAIKWHHQVGQDRSLWQRIRSPRSGLGTGPKAWALEKFPGAMAQMPEGWRTQFVKKHLPAEGAWWLRDRVENRFPIHFGATVTKSREANGRVALQLSIDKDGSRPELTFDHVIAGTGYDVNVDRIEYLDPELRQAIKRVCRAPKLNANFESSVPGLSFVGPTSAMSFGPLFRFVVGAGYTAKVVSGQLAKQIVSAPMVSKPSYAA